MSGELSDLVSAVCDNRATEEELLRLAKLLRDDPAARDEYLRYVDLHAALADEALPMLESDIVDYRTGGIRSPEETCRGGKSPALHWLAIAASIAMIASLGFMALRKPASEIANNDSPTVENREPTALATGSSAVNPRLTPSAQSFARVPIATVLLLENCRWSGDAVAEGNRLSVEPIELESGTAVLRFDGGAELVLVGPAKTDLRSAGSVLVHFGNVIVRATDGAEGFVVTTPTSEVVDLGTEFAVNVSRNGATEVHVLDGEVSYRGIHASEELAKILRAGEGIAIDPSGRQSAVPMNSPRFQEFVHRVNPRSRADLLNAYEGFNYSPGILPLAESTVGKGWAGPWRRRLTRKGATLADDTTPDHFEIVHGEMNVAWPVPGGRLGSLKLPSGGAFYARPMRQAVDLGHDGVAFFSLMVREIERRDASDHTGERLRLTLRSAQNDRGPALSFGHGPGFRPTVQSGEGRSHSSAFFLPAEQTTLWIGKIVARKRGEDEVYFRIYGEDDVLDYAEPATWHVVTRGVDLDARLDLVLLSNEGKTARLVDELRVGPTWRSVAPILETQE